MRDYRIVRISDLDYRSPMVALYKSNPGLALQSYVEQQKVLFRNMYVFADSFSRTMRDLGHDAHEIVCDLEILQKTWAREKGIKYNPDCWKHDIILAQIRDIKPDIVYFQDIYSLPYSIRKNLKAQFPFIKLIVIYRGYPGVTSSTLLELALADVLFIGSPILVKKCINAGLRPHLVYHSFDKSILDKIDINHYQGHSPKYDFTFVGSSGYGYFEHQSRYWALVELIQRTNLAPWIIDRLEMSPGFRRRAKDRIRRLVKSFLQSCDAKMLNKMLALNFMPDKLRRVILEVVEQRLPPKPLSKLFPNRCHAPVFGVDMYRILHQSKVTFNKHSDPAEDTVDNMRMFEATGVGTCLLTDAGKNMPDLFEEDHEVVTYSSMEECIEKVNYLLRHDEVRRQIAAAGQRRTLKDHTIMNRCRQIDDILQKML